MSTINNDDLQRAMADSLGVRGRVALVTGGSRGIGRAAVDCFARLGVHVVVNYVSDANAASITASSARAAGVEAITVQADVSQVEEADRLVDETLDKFGRIDFLVCNAGIWEAASIEEMTEDLWDRTIDLNLKGTWTICRGAVRQMKQQSFGRIVIISSTAGQRGEAGVSNYAASKGGQIAFTKSLAAELAEFGINVNAVAPGWVATDMCADVFTDEEYRKSIESTIPLGRIATAHDIGWPIVFLCSEWARHITGEILNVNGGSVLCG
ncbi:MAG: 3-oxoacyl-[acyl-carrier protein] reductase [Blastocatellia bacterium]|jgi:3-oxoacyl-[acyl-carrier protein] reductase|nr:3-oxoacyl-[acyl-carrier protein] reductase [Blastocatellia bacterium]